MGLTRLTGFAGEAEVLGHLVEVDFNDGSGLTLRGITRDDAMAVLDRLANKQLVSVNPAIVATGEMSSTSAATFAVSAAKAEPLPPSPKTIAESNAVSAPFTPPAPTAAKVREEIATAMAKPEVSAPSPGETSMPDVTKAKQLKDVLTILMEHHGIKAPADLIAKCLELKPTVPVLRAITDIPGRVERALTVMSA